MNPIISYTYAIELVGVFRYPQKSTFSESTVILNMLQ